MDHEAERILIVGVGNELLGDEGVGVHVVRALQAKRPGLPEHVDVLEAGTSLMDALPRMATYSRVIIVDAVRAGKRPGSIHRIEADRGFEKQWGCGGAVSLHELGVAETLAIGALMGLRPKSLLIVGAEPERMEPGMQLTPRLVHAARRIVSMLLSETRHAGRPASRRSSWP